MACSTDLAFIETPELDPLASIGAPA